MLQQLHPFKVTTVFCTQVIRSSMCKIPWYLHISYQGICTSTSPDQSYHEGLYMSYRVYSWYIIMVLAPKNLGVSVAFSIGQKLPWCFCVTYHAYSTCVPHDTKYYVTFLWHAMCCVHPRGPRARRVYGFNNLFFFGKKVTIMFILQVIGYAVLILSCYLHKKYWGCFK